MEENITKSLGGYSGVELEPDYPVMEYLNRRILMN
jgi:hypothetical protein